MKIITIMLATLFAFNVFAQQSEVVIAEQARSLLSLPQNAAGFGKKQVCHTEKKNLPKGAKKGTAPQTREVCKMVNWFNVALAVKRGNEPLTIIKADGEECTTRTAGFVTGCWLNHIGKTNGVATEFHIEQPKDYKVYGVRRWVYDSNGKKFEVTYSPYSDELNTQAMRATGHQYLVKLVEGAKRDLRTKGIRSNANPAELVVDRIPTDTIVRLATIEHVDHARFQKEGIQTSAGEVLVTYALNGGLAYSFSKSKMGARGLLQYTRKTYQSIVKKYPNSGLINDFVKATANAHNMAKAALLLADDDLSQVPLVLRVKIFANNGLLEDTIASAYNGGIKRPRGILEKGLDLARDNRNEENRIYVEKIRALRKVGKIW